MFCGGVAGACLWTAIYPIDVIKSRIQVQSLVGPMPGFLSTAIKTYKTEGMWYKTAIYSVDSMKSTQVQSLMGPMPGFLAMAIKRYKTEGEWYKTAIYPEDFIQCRIKVQSLVGPMRGILSMAIRTYKTINGF